MSSNLWVVLKDIRGCVRDCPLHVRTRFNQRRCQYLRFCEDSRLYRSGGTLEVFKCRSKNRINSSRDCSGNLTVRRTGWNSGGLFVICPLCWSKGVPTSILNEIRYFTLLLFFRFLIEFGYLISLTLYFIGGSTCRLIQLLSNESLVRDEFVGNLGNLGLLFLVAQNDVVLD